MTSLRGARGWWRHLYAQVLVAILLGAALGAIAPDWGGAMKPLADAFIAAIKMVISPVIFLTLVTGIAHMRGLGELGRVAARAFGYFITVSSLALLVGLVVANVVRPGAGLHIDPASLDPGAVADIVDKAAHESITGFLLDIIPTTIPSALTDGSILQVLFVALLFGISAALVGEPARPVIEFLERLSVIVFRLVAIIMRAAPIGAFGAIAFTVGHYGIGVLANLAGLVACVYLTSALFVLLVLGAIARLAGFSILKLLAYLKGELLLVLGTSSSESALPALIGRLESAGCEEGVVGQATGVELSLADQLLLLGVAVISSKGAAGVTGAGFITLAATLAVVPSVPVAGMALILGVDRFLSECRALTNIIGNAVATIVIARWEGALDRGMLERALNGKVVMED
jgi:aerobic C4-dicarboxylate transport protein